MDGANPNWTDLAAELHRYFQLCLEEHLLKQTNKNPTEIYSSFCFQEKAPQYLCDCSAIWVNPTGVTTVMVPMHTGPGKRVNTPMTAGNMEILTTVLAGTHTHTSR